jgi:dTDP-4-amino-4,6-dideoxygalactose transaminase
VAGGAASAAECAFGDRFGHSDPVLVRGAAAGILCALLAVDVGPGDEVVLPVSICQTAVNAVFLAGAVPVLTDCNSTLALCPDALAAALTPRTRAVVFHHPCGLAVNLGAVRRALAGHSDVLLVEDCAQALGAHVAGCPVGLQGDVAVFSFGEGKPLPAGIGGIVAAADPALRPALRIAARTGVRGVPDDVGLGVNTALSERDAEHVLERLRGFDAELGARLAGVHRQMRRLRLPVLGGAAAEERPFAHVFHRVVVEVPAEEGPELDARVAALDAGVPAHARGLAQTAVPVAPYEAAFVDRLYGRLGRGDLADPGGERFPVWRRLRPRLLYLRTVEDADGAGLPHLVDALNEWASALAPDVPRPAVHAAV